MKKLKFFLMSFVALTTLFCNLLTTGQTIPTLPIDINQKIPPKPRTPSVDIQCYIMNGTIWFNCEADKYPLDIVIIDDISGLSNQFIVDETINYFNYPFSSGSQTIYITDANDVIYEGYVNL